ncbi:MAG: hypothetical protein QOF25_1995 [Mycobacterium sp.]|nr:hypothetical protein [Mycobacterium sp.]
MASAVDTAVIAVIGVFFLGMGMYALAAPAMLVRPFGIALEQCTSRAEVRAVSADTAWRWLRCWRTRPLTPAPIEPGSCLPLLAISALQPALSAG